MHASNLVLRPSEDERRGRCQGPGASLTGQTDRALDVAALGLDGVNVSDLSSIVMWGEARQQRTDGSSCLPDTGGGLHHSPNSPGGNPGTAG